jgi:nitrite reductase (NO-forming)
MPDQPTPRLSDLVEASDRRAFLARASALSLAIPGVGAALAACSPSGGGAGRDSGQGAQRAAYRRYDPALPAPPANGRLQLHWHAREVPVRITDDLVVAAWTFEGDVPGPIVHCRVGDTVEFTLTNDVQIPHSMDFHAAQIDPRVAFRSATQGQSVSFTFTPKWAGAFMYHCGTAPVLMHIGAGMYGALIVSPREPLPPAKGFVLVQSEYYLADAPPGTPLRGVQTFSVPAGGGMCFELVCDVPGEFPFVNHGFGHGQKGAIGILLVEP